MLRPYAFAHSRNLVGTGRGSATLSPLQADIFAILASAYPGGVTRARVIDRVYGHRVEADLPTDPANVLTVKLVMLRRRIRPLGLDIKSAGGTLALVATQPALSDDQAARREAYDRIRRYV